MTLTNGAQSGNIFIRSSAAITFGGTMPQSIQGIFMAVNSITFNNSASVTGKLYSTTGNVTFIGVSSVNGNVILGAICFPGDTPVKTDQGEIAIANIRPNFHTIDGERIVAISETRNISKVLIAFEKDSLGKNYPSKRTLMTQNHKVFFKGRMMEAYKFVIGLKGVSKISYTGEAVYNILMEDYRTISVNNLICETLHPENPHSKVFEQAYNTSAEIVCA